MKQKYTKVPLCPRCGSKKTGEYVYGVSEGEAPRLKALALKKGELIYPVEDIKTPDSPNCHCFDCHGDWFGEVKTIRITNQELEQIKKEKGITSDLVYQTEHVKKINKHKKKQAERQEVLHKATKGVLSVLLPNWNRKNEKE